MKRSIATLVLTAVAIAPAFAGAGGSGHTGTVQIGHPITGLEGGVTELAAPCDPGSDLQGLDGWWHAVPSSAATASVEPTGDTAALADFDVFFYDADCVLIGGSALADGIVGEPESGPVPEGAAWLIADLFIGAQAGFELSFS